LSTHGQSLDDICAATEPTVDQQRYAAPDCLDNFGQDLNGPAAGIHHTPAVIGDNNPVNPYSGSKYRVFVGKNSFEYNLHLGGVPQALDPIPC